MDLDVFRACQTRRMYESKPPQRGGGLRPPSTEGACGALCGFPLWGLAFVHSACLTSSEDIKIHQNASRFAPIHPSSPALAQFDSYWAIWVLYMGVPFSSVVPPLRYISIGGHKIDTRSRAGAGGGMPWPGSVIPDFTLPDTLEKNFVRELASNFSK